ncbi:MAG TPA: hypothetical protein DCY88_19985, partial [Cyanobacteria bacterium UBA11372]|nr:hypothetical protein [Cyanobacteria bacterium UBA11372]
MSFVNESGAGAMSEAMTTSSTGETSHASEQLFTAGATSSRAGGSVHNNSTEAFAIAGGGSNQTPVVSNPVA